LKTNEAGQAEGQGGLQEPTLLSALGKIGRKKVRGASGESPVERVPRKKLKAEVAFGLVARSAGWCEFRGCKEFLFENRLTKTPGNYAENAHIVGFREDGPRGRDGDRPLQIDSIENLMLLCPTCHKLIDDHPAKYTRQNLEIQKREHEARIKRVTSLGPAMQTTVLQVKARIGANIVEISRPEVAQALMPRYPAGDSHLIDLTNLGDEKAGAFYELAAQRIREEVRRLYIDGAELQQSKHLSVFGLAPIPLLVVLGNSLSNKVQSDFFQCHRDQPDRWTWQEDHAPVEFQTAQIRHGSNTQNVALVLSLSGSIDISTLPATVDGSFSVYEISLKGQVPHPGFLRQRQDLESFRTAYRNFLANLRREHPGLGELKLFPAVPAPVAVVCGYDLLPKIDPDLAVYDNVKAEGGFIERMKVHTHEQH
jgi:hypothetical protein